MKQRRIIPIGGVRKSENEGELARELLEGSGAENKGQSGVESNAEETPVIKPVQTSSNLDIKNMLREYLPQVYNYDMVVKQAVKWIKRVFREKRGGIGLFNKKRWLRIEEIARYIQDSGGVVTGGDPIRAANELLNNVDIRKHYYLEQATEKSSGRQLYTFSRFLL